MRSYLWLIVTALLLQAPPSTPLFARSKAPSLQSVLRQNQGSNADGLQVRWSRLANSQRKIRQALEENKGSPLTMIQGDVLIDEGSRLPVMAYQNSNLEKHVTLERWLLNAGELIRGQKAGLKLNILYDNTTKQALSLTAQKRDTLAAKGLRGPFWFHANVLRGPNSEYGPLKPIDAQDFIRNCQKYFKDGTISLGWSTYVVYEDRDGVDHRYTWHDILEMLKLILPLKQNVNVVFRAAFVKNLTTELAWLLSLRPTISVTVWNYASDFGSGAEVPRFVDTTTAVAAHARTCVDRSRLFLDTYPGLQEAFARYMSRQGRVACPSESPERFNHHEWELIRPEDQPDILPGPFGIIFLGNPNSAIMSRNHVQAPKGARAIPDQQIRGTVHFVAREKDGPLSSHKSNIPTLTIHLKQDLGPGRPYPIDKSIKVNINALGRLYLEDGRDSSAAVERRPRSSADFCQFPCYDFIVNDYHDKVVLKVRLSSLCTGLNRTNVRIAKAAQSVKEVTLDIAPKPTTDKHRYRRSSDKTLQANYVLVQKGQGDNRLIVERLKHQELTPEVQSMGFGSARAVRGGGILFLCFALSVSFAFM